MTHHEEILRMARTCKDEALLLVHDVPEETLIPAVHEIMAAMYKALVEHGSISEPWWYYIADNAVFCLRVMIRKSFLSSVPDKEPSPTNADPSKA